MTDFVSQAKAIGAPQEMVYGMLSDGNNLAGLKDRLPSDKVSEVVFDTDSCRFKVNMPGVGEIALRIVEREPYKTIKVVSEQSPIAFTAWLQLKEKNLSECYVKITLRADVPLMLSGMLSKPLQEGVEKLAEAISTISYKK